METGLAIARGTCDQLLLPSMGNRHGLIAGATGTGKTITLRVMAEQLSSIGVPVFVADVKGDLSGLGKAGGNNPKVAARAEQLQLKEFQYREFPVEFWDVFGKAGHPVRTTVSDLGPLLLARLLNLNDTQAGVLNLVFKIADDQGLLLLDMKDLRAMVQHIGDKAADFRTTYGNISAASIGAIQRNLLALETQGAATFFGEPALDLNDFLQTDESGRGVINILAADQLVESPKTYATLLLWLLSELFENLPEVGDVEKPKLVFFFDEAHLLFGDAPKVLLEKVEQVVRLIRSKGVGVYFVTQNPLDVPQAVLGQLGNRVQHALRAFTPMDQKAVRTAAQTFRPNPAIDTERAITELGVGEALVSLLDVDGRPSIVERALVYPAQSQVMPLSADERTARMNASSIAGTYTTAIDRESAYEMLKGRAEQAAAATPASISQPAARGPGRTASAPKSQPQSLLEGFAKSAARSIGTQIGSQLVRGIMGSLLGGSTRRRR